MLGERVVDRLGYRMSSIDSADVREVVIEDVRLIKKMAAGDSAALGSFYDRWSATVYSIAIAVVRSSQDAEEVVDDCFWQAWNQASRFDPGRGEVRSWILNIARSRALDKLKAARRRREDDLDAAPTELLATATSIEAKIDEEKRAGDVASALRVLPDAQRQAVEMVYYGGLSQTEIAESTGAALGTVKTRIRLGMQKLREVLVPIDRVSS
jgi:RNA polymerase sigma-70 factor (ECF subfamily)